MTIWVVLMQKIARHCNFFFLPWFIVNESSWYCMLYNVTDISSCSHEQCMFFGNYTAGNFLSTDKIAQTSLAFELHLSHVVKESR